tara:strand:+ start:1279 stop:1782 length:504 start_codon:yes stop_codon:yes gene_type:complete
MILYHPLKDANHCIYRMLSILVKSPSEISLERLRVIDFYHIFPHLLASISPWPNDIKTYKKYIKNIPASFESIPDKRRLFYELSEIHKQSISTLISKGIIDKESAKSGVAILIKNSIPEKILITIENDEYNKSKIFEVLTKGLTMTSWTGRNGFKDRSGLMEFIYDE